MIELLPPEFEETGQSVAKSRILIVALIVLAVASNFYLYLWRSRLIAEQEELRTGLNQLENENRELVAKLKQIKEYQSLASRANLALYAQKLTDLNQIVPQNLGLEEFKLREQTELAVVGQAETNDLVVSLLQRLTDYPYYANLELVNSQSETDSVSFELIGEISDEVN